MDRDKRQTATPRRGGMLGRFRRSQEGVTLVEFAVVGPIFFAIIGATMETALAFFAGYALDSAIIDTSRLIRTGQDAYTYSAAGDNYRNAVCGKLYGIFDCDELRISVRRIDSFDNFSMTTPLDSGTGGWAFTPTYEAPQPNRTMMIEAYYKWPIFFDIPGLGAGRTADGKRLLAATHVIRTEPYT